MHRLFTLFFCFLMVWGCKKDAEQAQTAQKKPEMNTIAHHKIYKKLTPFAKTELGNWKYFNDLSEYLNRFENTSPSDALNNANELKGLVRDIKENTIIKDLKSPAFNARINVLESEVLRLADMTLIPTITANDVNAQIDKIFLVFSSVNAKINIIFEQKKLNNDINLDDFFTLDSTETRKLKKKGKLFEYDD